MNLIAEVVRSKTLATQAELRDSRIKKTLKKLQQNNSETVTNENDKEIPKERYISPEKKETTFLIILILI